MTMDKGKDDSKIQQMRVDPNDLDSFILKIKFERASAKKDPFLKQQHVKISNKKTNKR